MRVRRVSRLCRSSMRRRIRCASRSAYPSRSISASNASSSSLCWRSTAAAASLDDAVELLRDRERGRAVAVDTRGRRRERGAQRGRADRRARAPARAGRRPTTPTSAASAAATPSRSSTALHVVVGDRIEVDALAARPDRRQQIVGRAGDEHDDRAIRRLLERLQHRVRRLVLVAAQPLGLEQHEHLALALDRRARRLGQDALAHVVLRRGTTPRPVRTRRRRDARCAARAACRARRRPHR